MHTEHTALPRINSIVTHNARFHADEVFGVAVLREVFGDEPTLIRTRDQAVITTGDIVLDVGSEYDPERLRFDHHQIGKAGARPNGVEYASFGLIWKHYGERLCASPIIADCVDRKVVQPIDAMDNGVDLYTATYKDIYPYTWQSIVVSFNPTWKESNEATDAAFEETVAVARKVLKREIVHATHFIEAQEFVTAAYEHAADKRLVVLDDNYPYMFTLSKYPEPLYVVLPNSQDTQWKVECMRNNPMRYENRKNFPEAWAGKRDGELARATGVPDALFCHTNRFLAVAKTKEGALALAKLAIDA